MTNPMSVNKEEIRCLPNELLHVHSLRRCSRCKDIKPLQDYYADKNQTGGYKYTCKVCECEFKKARRKVDPNRTREIVRRSYAKEEVKRAASERIKRYREVNREIIREREGRKRKSEHARASQKFRNAVASGKLVRPETCEECGAKGVIHGHHFDYCKPLEVNWLCTTCHGKKHRIS